VAVSLAAIDRPAALSDRVPVLVLALREESALIFLGLTKLEASATVLVTTDDLVVIKPLGLTVA
jgi:hypothetical protein